MHRDTALRRYLQRHIEPGLPDCPVQAGRWQNALVIPAYGESPTLLERMARSLHEAGPTLLVLVLNRPDTEPDGSVNRALRDAAADLPAVAPGVKALGEQVDLHCLDMDRITGPLPAKQGVGLARKTGFDLALLWRQAGAITGDWICSTDADALLPRDYFARLQHVDAAAGAAVFPFEHMPGDDPRCNRATALYELRLHHYVLGLEYATSPYAWHALGSCLAIRADTYAQVHGFPRRAGAEDFYLLNKAGKPGRVARLRGEAIGLMSRHSRRVPFGTGPAVHDIAIAGPLEAQRIFYHPACFDALRAVLQAVPSLRTAPVAGLPDALADSGLAESLARCSSDILQGMGLAQAVAHCRRHGGTPAQFLSQFHQWFDAFRTLKFIHAVREAGWPDLGLGELVAGKPGWWPDTGPGEAAGIDSLRRACARRWGWSSPAGVSPAGW